MDVEFVPQEVSDIDLAFPASVLRLMPCYEAIPKEFKRGDTKWNCLFGDCFYFGLLDLKLAPKDGIDSTTAWRHIRCIMGSFEPKHEHKEAACAYLLSLWFEDAEWKRKDCTK